MTYEEGATSVQDVIDARPVIAADEPLAEFLEHLTDTVVSALKMVDYISEAGAAQFREKFAALEEEQQTQFGVRVAMGLMTIRMATVELSAGVSDAFEVVDA